LCIEKKIKQWIIKTKQIEQQVRDGTYVEEFHIDRKTEGNMSLEKKLKTGLLVEEENHI